MTAEIIKLPFSHRAAARRPRRSKNGTPEERAAKASAPATVTNIFCRSGDDVPEEIRLA